MSGCCVCTGLPWPRELPPSTGSALGAKKGRKKISVFFSGEYFLGLMAPARDKGSLVCATHTGDALHRLVLRLRLLPTASLLPRDVPRRERYVPPGISGVYPFLFRRDFLVFLSLAASPAT